MWRRQNHTRLERIVVYDPRSLATVWVVDEVTGDTIAVPYRVTRADMTLAESEAARLRLQALKAADRTEARLFENVLQVRALEERGRTATARMKAERSWQARRAVLRPHSRTASHHQHPAPACSGQALRRRLTSQLRWEELWRFRDSDHRTPQFLPRPNDRVAPILIPARPRLVEHRGRPLWSWARPVPKGNFRAPRNRIGVRRW
jgi:hypothetical protein